MYRLLLSLSILAIPLGLRADTAADYFHRGAQFYVWGQKQKASSEISNGLTQYPKDPLLNGMAVLLQREEQQQKQQQNSQQQNQQNEQSEQQQQQQNSQAQQNKSDQKQQPASQPHDQKDQKDQQASQSSPQEQEKSGEQDEQEQAAAAKAAGQMTPEEARQLLDAQKGEEQFLQFKQPQKPVDRTRPFRDW